MTDEQETIAPGQETATEAEVVRDEPQAIPSPEDVQDQEQQAAEGEAEAEPAIETVEIEWDDGNKYVIPKALEGGILRNKDYTQKRQVDAERAKALDTRAAEIEQQAEATEAELQDRATAITIKARLDEYAKVDWDALQAQDPLGAQSHWRQYQMLKDQAGEVQSRLQDHTVKRTQSAQQDLAKRIEETATFARDNIPGWTPDMDAKIVQFAMSQGVSQDFLRKNMTPTLYKFAHLAYVGQQTMTKQAVPKALTPNVVPLKTVGGKSTPTSSADLASADMEAYVAARKKGVGGKPLR